MEYITRVVDKVLDDRMAAFNAVNIVGPKGCGKTRTAKERCVTVIEFQDEERRDGYLAVASTAPGLFLNNERPILFDEWQDAPKVWGTIRKECDDHPESVGEFYLTGSTSKRADTPHTGTGRITELTMYPMTLFETGESNGTVSLSGLFEGADVNGKTSDLRLEDLFFASCRGGWPRCLALKGKRAKLEVAPDYYRQIVARDMSAYDGVRRNPDWTRAILWSYARNMATLAKKSTIHADVRAQHNVSTATIDSYIEVLKGLFVLEDIDAWTPQIRSKTSIRASKKHVFVDPSIGIAALGLAPEYFNNDLDTFGHVFENLVLRDLLAYAQACGARVMHYRDDTGLEADAVFQLADGRYALIEIKLGAGAIPAAERSLLKFDELIRHHNEEASANAEHPGVLYRRPDVLAIICATVPFAYTTESGVVVVPVGCLRD